MRWMGWGAAESLSYLEPPSRAAAAAAMHRSCSGLDRTSCARALFILA